MNTRRQEGGSNSGPGESGQNGNSQGTTTTSAQRNSQTIVAGLIATTTSRQISTTRPTHSPIPTSTLSSNSSSNQKPAIIGGVIGGITSLLAIALFMIWLLNRRARKRTAIKRKSVEPVDYANLDDFFAGSPFHQSNRNNQHDSLLRQSRLSTPGTGASIPQYVGNRGADEFDPPSRRRESGDYFLPTYAESQAEMSTGGSTPRGTLNTSHGGSGSSVTVSTTSLRYSGGTPIISPLSTGGGGTVTEPQHSRDTMGFPVDAVDIGLNRGMSIVSPVPRHPLVHRESLERVVLRDQDENIELQQQDPSRLLSQNNTAGGC